MKLPIICLLLVTLLNVAYTKSTEEDAKKEAEETVKQKREPQPLKYEMKEVILYLTPSQIKAYESGQGLPQGQIQLEAGHSDEVHNPQSINTQGHQQINQEEYQHNLQNEAQQLENNKKLQQALQKEAANQLTEQVQLYQSHQQQISQHAQNHQESLPQQNSQNHQKSTFLEPQQIHQVSAHQSLSHQTQPQYPQSYSYLYFYPRSNQQSSGNFNLPQHQIQASHYIGNPSEYQSQRHEPFWSNSQFKLVPYEYNAHKLAEAIDIYNQPLTKSLVAQQLGGDNFNGQIMEFHQLSAHEVDVPHQLTSHVNELPNTSSQGHYNLEGNSDQSSHSKHEQLVESHQETQQGLDEEKNNFKENTNDPKQQQAQQLKAHLKHKEKIEEQKIEALKLDAHLQSQELQSEINKAEELKAKHEAQNQEVEHYSSLQQSPSKIFNANIDGHMDTLLSPLLQHHSVKETLEHTYSNQNEPKLETGFKPIVYAPKDDTQKYAEEVSRILKEFHQERQEAVAKAAAIAREPPVVVHQEEKIIRKPYIKVAAPTPFYVPVPHPYPVPLEIINHVPVPIVKVQTVEVDKPVPFEVEKHVPVPVIKNVAVNIDKPYIVEKHVPVEVTQKLPVKVTVKVPQKYTIIRHVWGH